ncbi:MAG: hypothetical protein ABSB59_16425 [Streptosporangiaceae bacterium]|jgi:hypothetical protein
MLKAAMGYLAAADATAMTVATQAQCLRVLEQAHATETAARASVLAALTSSQDGASQDGASQDGASQDGASQDGAAADFSPRAWLIRETGITAGAAAGHVAWARRTAAHPQVIEALAEGQRLSEPVARTICTWTDKLPGDCRVAADAILIVAAKTGANPRDLAEVFGGIYTLSRPRPGLPASAEPAPVEPAVMSAVAI